MINLLSSDENSNTYIVNDNSISYKVVVSIDGKLKEFSKVSTEELSSTNKAKKTIEFGVRGVICCLSQ